MDVKVVNFLTKAS